METIQTLAIILNVPLTIIMVLVFLGICAKVIDVIDEMTTKK